MTTTAAPGAPEFSAQWMFLVSVAGIPGYWKTKTGGETDTDVGEEWDGGSNEPELMPGRPTIGDVVLTRGYKRLRDQDLVAELHRRAGRWRTSVTIQPTDTDLIPRGRPTVYTALLRRVADPEVDAGSGESAMIEITLKPARRA